VLGTMMFGAWGNTDHDDSIRIIHRVLDAGITSSIPPRDLLGRRPEQIFRKAARDAVNDNGEVSVSSTVRNTGNRAGAKVAQIYAGPAAGQPLKG
jgi:hypothetical protein